jgi:hypothetical protein
LLRTVITSVEKPDWRPRASFGTGRGGEAD